MGDFVTVTKSPGDAPVTPSTACDIREPGPGVAGSRLSGDAGPTPLGTQTAFLSPARAPGGARGCAEPRLMGPPSPVLAAVFSQVMRGHGPRQKADAGSHSARGETGRRAPGESCAERPPRGGGRTPCGGEVSTGPPQPRSLFAGSSLRLCACGRPGGGWPVPSRPAPAAYPRAASSRDWGPIGVCVAGHSRVLQPALLCFLVAQRRREPREVEFALGCGAPWAGSPAPGRSSPPDGVRARGARGLALFQLFPCRRPWPRWPFSFTPAPSAGHPLQHSGIEKLQKRCGHRCLSVWRPWKRCPQSSARLRLSFHFPPHLAWISGAGLF